ncbi:hypothetical protein COZ14_03440 [Candidatus Dojkabacteria bacterium CG_4_10_14_3_um_filter_Dojkabacteria_WS6_41_9]|uniref:Thioredoxin domain-containing protein n=1 Tax=Candidatus Dojkabacteria bacterium CG_4_10_14_0_2_um_filter_Dojkabacteria_WS6_41_15 TaxID=2014249 RepID=A0A2M7W3A2_9BACT|nr:MAG: hypothetical protein COZ14_03440 [Candidatus Dojkabacteria bacterium CG_4_10_14_3_um_filter_Dojkabacteria_WS6_41_9]PJA15975.1 MAG: hypothetical protein COX64_00080 [Candidatus Dojkabacteria bacterium CG_4_10_14_0_2_um_filter_Dojkabacteria_WS6_41_15]
MDFKSITLKEFENAINQKDKPVIVDFWAISSIACGMYKERLDIAHEQLADYALFGSVEIEKLPELTERFSIITIPTTLIFYKGEIAKQYMGIQEPETLFAAIEDITGKKIKLPEKEEEFVEE